MNLYEETKRKGEEIVSKGLPNGHVLTLRPTNVFGVETLKMWLNNSLSARLRRFLKGNEHAHLVYVKDVVEAAVYLFRRSPDALVDTYIISSDEEAGNTYRAVQAFLALRIDGAPSPGPISAPIFIPHLMRRVRSGDANVGDIIYSSRKLANAGFRFPFGLKGGLTDAVDSFSKSPDVRPRTSDSK
jgi:nucleoside-diphosphate-sugar epimerase